MATDHAADKAKTGKNTLKEGYVRKESSGRFLVTSSFPDGRPSHTVDSPDCCSAEDVTHDKESCSQIEDHRPTGQSCRLAFSTLKGFNGQAAFL